MARRIEATVCTALRPGAGQMPTAAWWASSTGRTGQNTSLRRAHRHRRHLARRAWEHDPWRPDRKWCYFSGVVRRDMQAVVAMIDLAPSQRGSHHLKGRIVVSASTLEEVLEGDLARRTDAAPPDFVVIGEFTNLNLEPRRARARRGASHHAVDGSFLFATARPQRRVGYDGRDRSGGSDSPWC